MSEGNDKLRSIGWLSAAALVVGSMVGSGIFQSNQELARLLGGEGTILWCWAIGGLLALAGALCYGELGAMIPDGGAEVVYLRRAYGETAGYLSGMVTALAGFAGPSAVVALTLARYGESLCGLEPKLGATLALLLFGAIHAYGVRVGTRLNDAVTLIKVALLVAFVAGGLLAEASAPSVSALEDPGLLSSKFARGLVIVGFAYTGWNAAAYVAGEIRGPARSLPRALILGTLFVAAVYLAMNVVYFRALSPAEMARVSDTGRHVAERLMGAAPGFVLNLGILALLASTLSAFIMAGPRILVAMARRGELPRRLADANARGAPAAAVALLTALSILFLWTVSFGELLVYVGMTLTLSTGLTAIAVIVLRRREPAAERPFRVPGYPVVPAAYGLFSAWILVWSCLDGPTPALGAIATLGGAWILRPVVAGRRRYGGGESER